MKEWESTITVQVAGLKGDIRLIDPMDGSIYQIPESMIAREGEYIMQFNNIPIKDYPLILAFGDIL